MYKSLLKNMRLMKTNLKLVSKEISPFDPVLFEVQKRDIEAALLADQLLSFPSVPEKHKINSETTQRKVCHDRLLQKLPFLGTNIPKIRFKFI